MSRPHNLITVKNNIKNGHKASVVAVLIFEFDYDQKNQIGSDFYTQFISANLGSLVSQGLLNGEHKVR